MPTGIGGEVGWWCPSLDDAGNGTSTLTDLSGNGNNGTLTNMDPATDWVTNTELGGVRAITLDGDEYIDVPDGILSLTQWTLCGWGKVASTSQGFLWGSSFGGNGRSYVGSNSTGVYWRVGSMPNTSVTYTTLNTWVHYCIQFDNGTAYLYVDGVLADTATGVSYGVNAAALTIGSFAEMTNSSNWIGQVDDLRAFTRITSAAENALLASQRGYQPSASANPTAILQINSHSMRVGL